MRFWVSPVEPRLSLKRALRSAFPERQKRLQNNYNSTGSRARRMSSPGTG